MWWLQHILTKGCDVGNKRLWRIAVLRLIGSRSITLMGIKRASYTGSTSLMQSCKKPVYKLWSSFRIMFLGVKIAKTLNISSSALHNIKRVWQSGEISVPSLDASDLGALGQQCMNNRHDFVTGITAWAQKSLSVNVISQVVHKCRL